VKKRTSAVRTEYMWEYIVHNMLINECPAEKNPLMFGMDHELPFCQQIVQWEPESVTCRVASDGKPGEPFQWTFRVPQDDICFEICVTGKIVSASFGLGGRETWAQKNFHGDGSWSYSTLPERTETLDLCFAPIRFGMLNPTLKVSARDCPVVKCICVTIQLVYNVNGTLSFPT
jgi:hypothetical protein